MLQAVSPLHRTLRPNSSFRQAARSCPAAFKSTFHLQLHRAGTGYVASRSSIAPRSNATPLPGLHRALHSTARHDAIFPFKLHDIGEGIAEVELLKWHVEIGQKLEEFDVLCEVQSDKSTVELTSPTAGVVKRLGADEGAVVKVGQLICDIEVEGSEEESTGLDSGGPSGEGAHHAEETQSVERQSREAESNIEQSESPSVTLARHVTETLERQAESGSAPTTPAANASAHTTSASASAPDENDEHDYDESLFRPRDSSDLAGGAQFTGEGGVIPSAPSAPSSSRPAATQPLYNSPVVQRDTPNSASSSRGKKEIVKASPAVRTLAARLGVDLAAIRGTGEGGRVTKEDVEGFAAAAVGHDEPEHGVIGGSGSASQTAMPGWREKEPTSTRVEFGRTRKVMYRAMGDMGSVPHFGYSHTLNLTPLLPYIQSLNRLSASHRHGDGEKEDKRPYLASDLPSHLARDPLTPESNGKSVCKTTLLSFIVKTLLLAMEEHPIMRSRAREADGGKERWLEVARDGTIAVAVSDPKAGLLTPSLPPLSPTTPLSSITSHLTTLRSKPTAPSPPGNLTISSVGSLGEATGAMPVLPPGGGVAICVIGRAKWETEWRLSASGSGSGGGKAGVGSGRGSGRGIWDLTPEEVESGGMRAVLRCPVGWSGDHRILEGAELIAFTETWKKYVEEPWRWIKVDG